MNPKVAIGLLALIIVLFVVGASCGALPKDSNADPGWADSLGRLLVKQGTIDDLRLQSGPCTKIGGSLNVPKGQTCGYQVDDLRRISLTATQGISIVTVTRHGAEGAKTLPARALVVFLQSRKR